MNYYFIGNGFDLASGLETTFEKYMNERFQQNKRILDKLNKSFKKNFYFFSDVFYCGNESKEYDLYYNFNNKFIKSLVKSDITFWDLIFNFLMNNNELMPTILGGRTFNIIKWCDVEKIIEIVVMNVETNKIIFSRKHGSGDYHKIDEAHNIYSDNPRNYSKADFFKETIYNYYCYKLGIYNTYSYKHGLMLKFLLEELKIFEEGFRRSISSKMHYIENNLFAKKKYINNLKVILNSDCARDFKLINFNYSFLNISNDISNIFPEIKFNEFNVHGLCTNEIIFGIDQKDVWPNTNQFLFTKTYRKIFTKDLKNEIIFTKNDYNINLIFFGHSLAKADYSYFQTFFDYYDLYSGFVKLFFKYTIFNKEEESRIEEEHLSAVVNLITEYGQTMNNKDHGKNLLHKLIIEGRLIIEKIEYEDFLKVPFRDQ